MLLVGLCVSVAAAETTSEQSGSILIFPKVIFDGNRDTLIQVTNTSNSMVNARCFYVNAAPVCLGVGDCLTKTCTGTCVPQCQEVDFNIWLTKQQPTHWAAAFGRFTNPLDIPCDRNTRNNECDGAGIDPGRVPPVADPFFGELRCIEVDQSGAPISGNHLKGEATIVTRDGDASKYNAVAILGEPFTNNGDNRLCLGGGVTEECQSGAEYDGCGERVILNHFADGADSPLFGATSTVRTEVTLVPCQADFELQASTRITVQFELTNEFEQPLSTSTTVDCWRTFFLDEVGSVFGVATTGTRLVQTRMRPSTGSPSSFVGVVEEYHLLDDEQGRTAFNLHEEGTRGTTDLIYIPEGP